MADSPENEGPRNFLDRFFGSQVDKRDKPDISNVTPVEELDKNTNRPTDPMTDVEPGRIFGQSLVGEEWKGASKPQAVEAPPLIRPKKARRAQATSNRSIRDGRRKLLAAAAGAGLFASGLTMGAVKTGEVIMGAISNAAEQTTASRMQQERDQEEARKKMDTLRGIPHKSNAEIMEELRKP